MSDYDFIDDVVNEIMTNVKKDKPQKRDNHKRHQRRHSLFRIIDYVSRRIRLWPHADE